MGQKSHADGSRDTVLDTRDLDEARARVGTTYCPHTLRVMAGAEPFHAVLSAASLGEIAVHRLSYGATTFVEPVPLESWFLISSPVAGALSVRSGREERDVVPGGSVVLDPYREFSLRFSGCRLLTFRLQRGRVEELLAEVAGLAEPVSARFGIGGPESGPSARAWRAVSSLLVRASSSPGFAADHPLLRTELERTAIVAMAETHPLQGLDHPRRVGWAPPRSVRTVMTLVESAPERPFSLTELAAAAGVSPRALQAAFRRHLDATPLGFVRSVRMRRAHEDLVAADTRDGTTVTEVAYRWGFGNLGRFAHDHEQRYGCLPSETLRG